MPSNRSPELVFVDLCSILQAGVFRNGPGPNFGRKPAQIDQNENLYFSFPLQVLVSLWCTSTLGRLGNLEAPGFWEHPRPDPGYPGPRCTVRALIQKHLRTHAGLPHASAFETSPRPLSWPCRPRVARFLIPGFLKVYFGRVL